MGQTGPSEVKRGQTGPNGAKPDQSRENNQFILQTYTQNIKSSYFYRDATSRYWNRLQKYLRFRQILYFNYLTNYNLYNKIKFLMDQNQLICCLCVIIVCNDLRQLSEQSYKHKHLCRLWIGVKV